MKNSFIKSPRVKNEEVLLYAPGSKEKDDVLEAYNDLYKTKIDIKLKIDGKELDTKYKKNMYPPMITITNWVPTRWQKKVMLI